MVNYQYNTRNNQTALPSSNRFREHTQIQPVFRSGFALQECILFVWLEKDMVGEMEYQDLKTFYHKQIYTRNKLYFQQQQI